MLNYCSVFHFMRPRKKTENCEDQKKKTNNKKCIFEVCAHKLIISQHYFIANIQLSGLYSAFLLRLINFESYLHENDKLVICTLNYNLWYIDIHQIGSDSREESTFSENFMRVPSYRVLRKILPISVGFSFSWVSGGIRPRLDCQRGETVPLPPFNV